MASHYLVTVLILHREAPRSFGCELRRPPAGNCTPAHSVPPGEFLGTGCWAEGEPLCWRPAPTLSGPAARWLRPHALLQPRPFDLQTSSKYGKVNLVREKHKGISRPVFHRKRSIKKNCRGWAAQLGSSPDAPRLRARSRARARTRSAMTPRYENNKNRCFPLPAILSNQKKNLKNNKD